MENGGGVFFNKWTFPQRRVHYVQYQYFFILHFTYLGGAYTPNASPANGLAVCVHSISLAFADAAWHRKKRQGAENAVSPRLWNQLPASLRQPRSNLSSPDSSSPLSGISSVGSIDSPLQPSITPPPLSFQA